MSSLTQFFLNPAYVLPGAALVLVPILIHILSRLRYKKVRFAAMEFLLESEELNRRRIVLERDTGREAQEAIVVPEIGERIARP